MIKDITIGQFFPGTSFLHRLDARMKIVLTFAIIVIIFLCKSFFSLGLMVVFTVALILVSRVPLKTILKSLKPIIFIVVFTALLNIFYTTGDANSWTYEFWIFKITEKGVFTALFMAVRIICLVIISSLLTYTTTPTGLTDALERLLSPLKVFKIEAHTIAMMMTLALRFIPTLIEEIDRIMNAQKARGANWESGSLVNRAKALIPVLIPLFVSSFRRAYELAFAMECRCYTGGKGRTRMKQMKFGVRDFAALVLTGTLLAGIISLNIFFPKVI
ncbi:MAG: energy-coupling factor transporter transmembrane protein EcfT [Clostridiales bacterium]|nr:energy-coupling factor transporter transmembrane protein EcfT [Clostridiales bacterium]